MPQQRKRHLVIIFFFFLFHFFFFRFIFFRVLQLIYFYLPLGERVLDEDEDQTIPNKRICKESIQKKPKPKKKIVKASMKPTPAPNKEETANTDPPKSEDADGTPKSRAPNYKEDENVQICRSWLEITEDPLNSTNQTADTFWTRVEQHYSSQIPFPPRSFHSLKSRWQAIQRAVNKFHGCFKQVVQANQSGTSSNDQISSTLKLYTATEGKTFPHLRCYHILSRAPKWHDYCDDLEQKKIDTTKNTEKNTNSAAVDLSSKINPLDAASDLTAAAASSPSENG